MNSVPTINTVHIRIFFIGGPDPSALQRRAQAILSQEHPAATGYRLPA
jgi:hypothetical protein